MRRIAIYVVIGVIAVFIVVRVVGCKGPAEKPAATKTEIAFNKAAELRTTQPEQAIVEFEKVVTEFPESVEAQKALVAISEIHAGSGDTVKEEETLQRLITAYPDGEITLGAKQRLWTKNLAVIFFREETPNSFMYEVKPGDTLYKIAKNNNTNVDLIMKSNDLTQTLIKPGMKLKIIKSKFSIVVSKPQNKLTLLADNAVVKEYPVGLGADNSTPVGKFKITNRIMNPVWYKTGAVVPAGSADNILGTRWLGLSEPGYGIHGTTDMSPISEQKTQGCVRMVNDDVDELFLIVPVGTEVTINE
ncbi:MAG: L,D-transpeptidase family protein [Candidatus Omnitrophica bacterium]|nr:L,D-transpeptidase family protein [Candidatus Omnitrophota bacterium]